ncbi:hypothetical protein T310_6597 [Rasamsonia emersonii CBS 393.64]|uniref:Uncharacterized protein n=1 Tax=Rasamsonia emersonii (strain ATCC 16479 / CBS 393.64 / IMI 116815) TaxID=1408163 RepID=A0A0F4YNI6_RASE3|nr:hypothetical protein T310_6597 [Rasamsonia emersonii CBS 393.64]KKA19421.1 hypothetical protein T310_6597 [Rasamsonia emersonii CBS 393.64]
MKRPGWTSMWNHSCVHAIAFSTSSTFESHINSTITGIQDFLETFQGLEELFFSADLDSYLYSRAVYPEESCLLRKHPTYWRPDMEKIARREGPSRKHLRGLNLECIGVLPLPNDVLSGTQLARADIPNLGVRKDFFDLAAGSDNLPLSRSLHDLAQWAFGPDGLPSLRVIAHGDFLDEGRYRKHNVLLCRDSGSSQGLNFRRVVGTEMDELLLDLFEEYSDFLQACPPSLDLYESNSW